MKAFSLLLGFLFLVAVTGKTQDRVSDSLWALIQKHTKQDTVRVNLLNEYVFYKLLNYGEEPSLAQEALNVAENLNHSAGQVKAMGNMAIIMARQGNGAKAISYAEQALKLAEQTGKKRSMAYALWYIGRVYAWNNDNSKAYQYFQRGVNPAHATGEFSLESLLLGWLGNISSIKGNYPQALDYRLKALSIAKQTRDMVIIAWAHLRIGSFYSLHNDFKQALNYQLTAVSLAEKIGNGGLLANAWTEIGDTYSLQGNFPEAIRAYEQCLRIHNTKKGGPWNKHVTLVRLADVYVQQKKYSLAREYAFASLNIVLSKSRKIPDIESESRRVLASVYLHTNNPDSARLQAESSLSLAVSIDDKKRILDAYQVLYQVCARQRDFAKAFHYQHAYMAYKDSLSRDESTRRLALLQYSQELDKKEASIALLKNDQQIKAQETRRQHQLLLSTLVGLGIVAFLALALFRNNRQKQKANTLLQKQKAMTEQALENLKATQTQLIHSEKMASLGELTAGIAHEIQNPLNFVNNFSEVNKELIADMKEELAEGNIDEVKVLVADFEENEQKINHHGQRADSIVKGMLQHSRASTGQKEPTNINALAEEYLRLSYHGLRAKDKNFNANLITDFDISLDKVSVVPQELGRVLLNLYNNAFYATQQKKIQLNGLYQPEVKISTSQQNGQVEIKVSDNGTGIPESVKNKIFQPFFTTKPTGQGTGLGLSLSYDIITKGHQGELKVETKEGEYSEFIVSLPVDLQN